MNKRFFVCIVTIVLSISSAYAGDWGYIVKDHYDCESDHMAIKTNGGWLLAEAYPPWTPLREGAYIFGDLTGYGFKKIQVYSSRTDTSPTSAKIYIDNYYMSAEDASHYCYTGEDL